MPQAKTLGERIAQARREKAAREHRDIAAGEVAEAVGVTPANYSRWESGERVPREDALTRLAAYLGVTPAYLRYGVTESAGTVAQPVTGAQFHAQQAKKPAAKKPA